MFGKLKDRLKGWFSASKEKAEEEEKKVAGKAKEEKKEVKAPKITKKQKEQLKKAKKKGKKELKKEEKVLKEEKKELEEKLEVVEEELGISEEEAKIEEHETGEKVGFFGKLFKKFKFTISEEYFEEIYSELEMVLLENNVAFEVVEKLKEELKKELVGKEIEKEKVEEEIRKALGKSVNGLFKEPFDIVGRVKEKSGKEPYVVVLFGINGSGKTTTIAKLAYLLKSKGFSVVLAAGDTFRAASIEQLTIHADKLGVKIVKNQYNSDPASVAFDAIKSAKANNIDVVLIDTAGRMHTKESLMKEMEKIVRVTKPDLKVFIGESITGNDAIEQAKNFNEMIGIDGIILSKADVDDKGGTALSVSYVTGKPILFLGVGQEYKDLKPFNKKEFLESLGLE